MEDRITYVGLDVHKEGIVVAVAEGGLRGEVREYGRIANRRRVGWPRDREPKVRGLVWGFSCQVVIFGFLAILCSERECRSSSRRLRSGARSARKGSRDRNA